MNRIKVNRLKDQLFKYFAIACTAFGILMLAGFLVKIIMDGATRIDWNFITNLPSRLPQRAGVFTALAGTIWVLVLTALIAIPLGISAGIYLEEFGGKSRLSKIIEINISNLAGVPSIIYGLLGLEIFGRVLNLGGSLLSGSLTLALLILPMIIVATREAIKAVPKSIKEASFGLGASKLQTIWYQLLPSSFGGILTGVILALSRAVGEASPLIVIGALAYVPFIPTSPMDDFSVMPIQIFNWVSRPQKGFIINAAAAILVLLVITFTLNGVALYFRNKWQRKVKW